MSTSGSASEAEVQASAAGSATPRQPGSYPPYPPYVHAPAPPSVAETIIAGRGLRVQHKTMPREQVHPLPKPARPKTPKVTDVKQSRRALRLHTRCMRRHGAVLTDRLERIAKPPRRTIIYLWREYADTLPAETIARLRGMLDADEPFKPDQAYEYFINMRKTKKYAKKSRINQIKRDAQAICADKRFVWARNATVAFARGIQQRLARPGRYALADGMLRLSNIILDEICGYMKMRTPSRRCTHPRAKFMMEMSDKVAVWIDGILSESDDRMLMMDFDEDDDLFAAAKAGGADGFTDDFLDMMGGSGLLEKPKPAYLNLTGETLEAFNILTDSMNKKGNVPLLSYGKFQQTYSQGANELKQAPDLQATKFNPALAEQLNKDLSEVVKPNTPASIAPFMKDMVDICSKYLAQNAEFNKDKGQAFKALIKKMKTKPNDLLYQKERATQTYGSAATELERANSLETDHDDPNLSQAIHSKLSKLMEGSTPRETKKDMTETLDVCSKYLSQSAVDEGLGGSRSTHAGAGGGVDDDGREGRRDIEAGDLGYDPDQEMALSILHKELKSKGREIFYQQPHSELTHKQASDWIAKPPMRVDRSVKESGDAARLHKKFERKLSTLVAKSTPPALKDSMQDVVIECSRILSEYFVSNNYKALVKDALISEMQRKGDEILIDIKGATETAFFAAQRLKKAASLEVAEPATGIAYTLVVKLDEIVRCRSMPRKLTATMKNHVREAADYLSLIVTTPDPKIEALVALLAEMEAQGSDLLVEGNITKSYEDSALYLQCLTSYEDKINLPNSSLQSAVASKLNAMMANVDPVGYTAADMRSVISEQTRLLVSYIMLQGVKTEALQLVIEQMDEAPEALLLRHATLRKSNCDGADLLRGKNTDQLHVKNADPVVMRKIQIKLNNLMEGKIPNKYQVYMDDVILDATMFLAIELFKPHVVHVCKCMKSVFVQCELWCDEILRRVARPCCACRRVVSTQALADLAPDAPHVDISIRPCRDVCRAPRPTPGCEPTTSYMLYSTEYNRQRQYVVGPTRLSPSPTESIYHSFSPANSMTPIQSSGSPLNSDAEELRSACGDTSPASYYTSMGPGVGDYLAHEPSGSSRPSRARHLQIRPDDTHARSAMEVGSEIPTRTVPLKEAFSCRTSIISTDQMVDWHAMMVSLTWNVQAWRNWIQETIDRALFDHHSYGLSPVGAEENWRSFHRRIATEALQWRQYNLFSRQLTMRLALRYRDKEIVSPTRSTVKTPIYMECQKEMLEIINMFNRWTHWLSVVVKESDSLQFPSSSGTSLEDQRWSYFKSKVEEYAEDWQKYSSYLKVCWEQTYMVPLKEWMPSWSAPGPVWVMSACGAVPSGAVAAGAAAGERTWLARTTHGCRVLPAALIPSRHCCLLYADGAVHHYTKYQVMCNARVEWVSWRAGAGAAGGAVRVAPGVLAGRVLYRGDHLVGAVLAPHHRCHVVIYSRPFAFNCYELLVMAEHK